MPWCVAELSTLDMEITAMKCQPLIGTNRFRELHCVCGQRPAFQRLLIGIKVTR